MQARGLTRHDLSFVVADCDEAKIARLQASLKRVLAREGFENAKVRVERAKGRDDSAVRFVPIIPQRTISRPVHTSRPAAPRAVRRNRANRARAPGGRGGDDDPHEPEPIAPWRGLAVASIRLHAHVLRRSAAMRVA